MKIIILFGGMTQGGGWGTAQGQNKDFLHCWPDHKKNLIDPFLDKGHEVSIRFSTYKFTDEGYEKKFNEIINPDKMFLIPREGQDAYTAKIGIFNLFDDGEEADFVIFTRADLHYKSKVVNWNICYEKFNFIFGEMENNFNWWEHAKFTSDVLWMWPFSMTKLVKKSLEESMAWRAPQNTHIDGYCTQRTDSHCMYNYLINNIASDDVHLIFEEPNRSVNNPYFTLCRSAY